MEMLEEDKRTIKRGIDDLCYLAHENAKDHGWYQNEVPPPQAIALMHCELSEALQALRDGNPVSEHIAPVSSFEEELADVIIRICDYAKYANLDLADAICRKMLFNVNRPYKHGKEF